MTARRPVDRMLVPAEVAALFGVDPKTVYRWTKSGRLPAIRTLGGHHRYKESDVRALRDGGVPAAAAEA